MNDDDIVQCLKVATGALATPSPAANPDDDVSGFSDMISHDLRKLGPLTRKRAMLEIQTVLLKYIEGVPPATQPPAAQSSVAQPPVAQPPVAQQQPVYNQSFTHMLNSW